jgi:hypothetical protein
VRRAALALAGAAILAAVSLTRVPWGRNPLRRPRSPFDRGVTSSVASGFALLSEAARLLPPSVSVVARTQPPDPVAETYFHRFAVSLLPGRRVLPAAMYGVATPPEMWRAAQYLVLIGPPPAQPPGRLLLETPEGTVWRLQSP